MKTPLRLAPWLATALTFAACSSPPIAPTVEIQPADPTTLDALSLHIVGNAEDADRDISYQVSWFADGSEIPDLSGALEVSADRTEKHQQWRAVVFPVDDKDHIGEPGEAAAIIQNSSPTVAVSITPDGPRATDDLIAVSIGDDVDDDALTYRYLWLHDGTETTNTDAMLTADQTSKGDKWTVRSWALDDDGEGEPNEASVGIENTLPAAVSVTLAPTEAYEDSSLTATAEGEDEDGDELTWTYAWFANEEALPDASGDTIDGAHFNRGDQITVQVTPNDGSADGDSIISEAVEILNSAPTATGAELGPDPAYEATNLQCEGIEFADIDGDAADWRYSWTVNGRDLSSTAATLTGVDFNKEDVISCTATPFDGDLAGATIRSSEITISNTAPALSKATIDNTSPKEGDTLTVTTDGVTDDDGDTVEMRYSWTVDGKVVSTNATLTSDNFSKGNKVQVQVTPFDGTDLGAPVMSTVVTVANTAPVVTSVKLSPTSPKTNDDLRAIAKTLDADGDKVTLRYTWYVNGSKVSPTTDTLKGSTHFSKGDTIYVSVTPNDGDDDGAATISASVKAVNTAPSITSVNLTPNPAFETNKVSCNPTGWSDDDKDKEGYKYSWSVNSKVVATTRTIDGALFNRGDKLVCTATPFDGDDSGTKVPSKTLTISNSAPTIASVTIFPTTPKEGNTLRATITDAKDADGDKITYKYSWYVDSKLVSSASTIDGSSFDKGQSIYVRVVPNDGISNGKATDSKTVKVANSAPVISSVGLSPGRPRTNQAISAIVRFTDVDKADTHKTTWDWYVNSKKVSAATSSLPSTFFVKHNTIYAIATVSDGTASATKKSAVITAVNTKPSFTSATISPARPTKLNTLSCAGAGWVDIDEDKPGYLYQWYRNKAPISGQTSSTLTSTYFARGQTVQCYMTPYDGEAAGTGRFSASVLIGNAPPSITSATLSPTSPKEGDTINVAIGGAKDVDGDRITYRYAWYVNSTLVSTSSTLTGSRFNKNQKIYVRVTPYDGRNLGAVVSSKIITSVNTAPVISSVALAPNPTYTNTHLIATPRASDIDTDKLSFSYAWYVNKVKQTGTTATLDRKFFKKGQQVYVIATANDGETSVSKTSGIRTISNSVPTVPGTPAVTPAKPNTTENLKCTTAGSKDADGDTLTYTYRWYRNSSLYGTYGITAQTHVLTSAATLPGQTWYCTVKSSDGAASSSYSGKSNTISITGSSGTGSTRANSGITCNTIKTRNPTSKTGHYWIDPDGDTDHSDAKQVYCDMAADGGGWTLLAWTNDSTVRRGSYYWGVPYPGTNLCTGITCNHGSFLTPTQANNLFDRSKQFAKSQSSVKITNYQPMSSYTYAGKYDYGSLKGLRLETGKVGCNAGTDGFTTGTFTSIKGASTYNGTKMFLNKGLRYASYDYSSAYFIYNVGTNSAYCSGNGQMPGTWIGSWSSTQYGPVVSTSGANAVWVR